MDKHVGLLIIIAGAVLVTVGALIYLGAFSWFGRLPGDVSYEGEHTRIYFPIISSVLLSIVLSLVFYLVRRFF